MSIFSVLRDGMRQAVPLIRADAWAYRIICGYAAFGFIFHWVVTGSMHLQNYANYFEQWIPAFLVLMPLIALLVDVFCVVHRFDKRRNLAFRQVFRVERLAYFFSGVYLMMTMVLFMGTFSAIKNTFPVLHGGFPYDRLQADLDAWLHLGTDPWRLLYAVGQYDWVRSVLEWNYLSCWFIVCFGALFFVVTSPRTAAIRTRYVLSFMFAWILCGNLVAGIFLSAGPAFYGAVTGDHARFAEQLAYLASSDSPASAVQFHRYLWSLYESGQAGFGSGISAFPSVHVALIAMTAFFAAEHSKRLGILAFSYVGVILVSTVYLGWHYAIDGYASLAIVAVCHFAIRRLMTGAPLWAPRQPAEPQAAYAGLPDPAH